MILLSSKTSTIGAKDAFSFLFNKFTSTSLNKLVQISSETVVLETLCENFIFRSTHKHDFSLHATLRYVLLLVP